MLKRLSDFSKKFIKTILPVGIVVVLCLSFFAVPSRAVNFQSVEITPAMIGVLLDSGILDCYVSNYTVNGVSQSHLDLNQYLIHTYNDIDFITIYSDQVPIVAAADSYILNIQLSFDFDFYVSEASTFYSMFFTSIASSRYINYQYVRYDTIIESSGTLLSNSIVYKPIYTDPYFDTYFNFSTNCVWGPVTLPASGSEESPYNALGFYTDLRKSNSVANRYAIPACTLSSFIINLDVDSFDTTSDETTSDGGGFGGGSGGGSGGDNAAIVAALNQLHQDLDDINASNQQIQADVDAVKDAISTPNQHQEDVMTSFEDYESREIEDLHEYHAVVSEVENGVRDWITSGYAEFDWSTDTVMPESNIWFDPFIQHRLIGIVFGVVGICSLLAFLIYGRW